jgi:hypothetical protein
VDAIKISLRTLVAVAAVALAGCSGGGGDSNPAPSDPSGMLDLTYGIAGKVAFADYENVRGAIVDGAGNAYVTGLLLVKVDRFGARIPGYGGTTSPPEFSPVLDGAGGFYAATEDNGLVKRDANGALVASFGTAGRVQVTPWRYGGAEADRLLGIQRDAAGYIIALGFTPKFNFGGHYAVWELALAKFDPTGRFVPEYALRGSTWSPIWFHVLYGRLASTIDSDGNLVVAGRDSAGAYFFAKLDSTGKLLGSTETSTAGWRWYAPFCGTAGDSGVALAAGPSGSMYFGVACEGASTVFKVNRQGELDGTWGSSGRASGIFPNGGSIGALLLAPDGYLYVAGSSPSAPSTASVPCAPLAVAKLDANGAVVTSFGTNGIAFPGANADTFPKMLALDSSGLLYVGAPGDTQCPIPASSNPYAIFRLRR